MYSVCMPPLGRSRSGNTHQLTVQRFSVNQTSFNFEHKSRQTKSANCQCLPLFYSSVHIPTRSITVLANLEGNPPSDFRDALTNCASAPTDATEEFFEYDAEEFLVFLTLLITEGRTPEYSVKGRTEGLHCPPAQSAMPPLHRHECSDKLPQVLFERTPTQRFSACTTRCVSCRSVDGGGLQSFLPPPCRLFYLFFLFYFWHRAFKDASLSMGICP